MKVSTIGRIAAGLSFAFVGACFLSGSYAQPKPADSGYHLLKTISLPPAPGGSFARIEPGISPSRPDARA